jgi:Ca2+-transporting ATPase
LYALDASLPGGFIEGTGDLRHAQTIAFTTLMLFQVFNVMNARSEDRSAFARPFSNAWLWAAIVGSIALQVLVIYTPLLQRAFGTVPLTLGDWGFATVVASSVLWMREVSKIITRLRNARLRSRDSLQRHGSRPSPRDQDPGPERADQ